MDSTLNMIKDHVGKIIEADDINLRYHLTELRISIKSTAVILESYRNESDEILSNPYLGKVLLILITLISLIRKHRDGSSLGCCEKETLELIYRSI